METRIYDIALKEKDEERERNFEKIAKELSVEPRKLLSHVLEYRIYADKL